MPSLTSKQILFLLNLLGREQVAEFNGYIVTREARGYSTDPMVGSLQAALSIALEVAGKSGR